VTSHNILLAHAAAVDIYRKRYQLLQRGRIGITNNCDWREPRSNKPEDIAAADRSMLFWLVSSSEPSTALSASGVANGG